MTTTWPYSTHDDVSHLEVDDVAVLRARIDQLLEERREWRRASGMLAHTCYAPREWRLTAGEERLLAELVRMPDGSVASKERLHAAFSKGDEPDTSVKIVDVIVCKLRGKLRRAGESPTAIETVWGRGYGLSADMRAKLRGASTT